jgi:methylated-DNA-[protein]-cysteine S-methyltransferase
MCSKRYGRSVRVSTAGEFFNKSGKDERARMTDKPAVCVRIEDDLLATATGEAPPGAVEDVERHIASCEPCRKDFEAYCAVEGTVAALRTEPTGAGSLGAARERLEQRLAELRRRLLVYGIFPSTLGNILIARSELGVSLIEYLERGTSLHASRLSGEPGVELAEDKGEVERTYRELLEYLQGTRHRLDWQLDLRLVRSDFHRNVLLAAAEVPYGAVIPYAGLAQGLGRRKAVRAVAQALRRNPLPIVIPCHRIIGTSGALTGYAGGKINLKQKLLAVEGVPVTKTSGVWSIAPHQMYVLYPGDREYCVPTCPSLDTRAPVPLTRFASRQHAETAGFAPCTTCRPDLHPISH